MLKYHAKTQTYRNSTKTNVVCDKGLAAWSYGHWQYLKYENGVFTFNEFKYSKTTSKHQKECLHFLATEWPSIFNELVYVYQCESL